MRVSRTITWLLLAAAMGLPCLVARADILQDMTVSGDPASLFAAGFGTLNGAGVNVGIVEADGGFAAAYYGSAGSNGIAPNSSLPNGNPDLPGARINFTQVGTLNLPGGQLPQGGPPAAIGAGYAVGNHASEVTGVVMGQGVAGPADRGISPASRVQFASLNPSASSAVLQIQDASAQVQLVLQQPSTPVVNMSWGFRQGTVANPANTGSNQVSQFVDWAAGRYNALMVVAGNEGLPGGSTDLGAPSDSYNSINVGATGARVIYSGNTFTVSNSSGATLNYGVAASYNRSNMTADVSPITGYGREKTDIVAPGGDPYTGSLFGSFSSAPVFVNKFQSTAGGQYEFAFSVSGLLTGGTSSVPFYENDVFNGTGGSVNGGNVTTGTSFIAGNLSKAQPGNPPASSFPSPNPGGFAAGDSVDSTAIAGTSFAAPLVSGAAALLYQYGSITHSSTDHRVIKALLLNGAAHTYIDPLHGTPAPLVEADGMTPWTRLPGAGFTPLVAGYTAAQFSGSYAKVRPGLDPQLGTGLLNVTNSLLNYAAGQQGPGNVNPIGWDTETVSTTAAINSIVDSYTFTIANSGVLSATLCWDDPVTISGSGAGNTYVSGSSTFTRTLPLADLDLYLFPVLANGSLGNNIDYSTSDIDNVEYLYDSLTPGTYRIDVDNAQYSPAQNTTFGLAWAVPEPASGVLLLVGGILLLLRRKIRGRRNLYGCNDPCAAGGE